MSTPRRPQSDSPDFPIWAIEQTAHFIRLTADEQGWSDGDFYDCVNALRSYRAGPVVESGSPAFIAVARQRFARCCIANSLLGLAGQACSWYPAAEQEAQTFLAELHVKTTPTN